MFEFLKKNWNGKRKKYSKVKLFNTHFTAIYHFKVENARGQTNHSPKEHTSKAEAVQDACFVKKSEMKKVRKK